MLCLHDPGHPPINSHHHPSFSPSPVLSLRLCVGGWAALVRVQHGHAYTNGQQLHLAVTGTAMACGAREGQYLYSANSGASFRWCLSSGKFDCRVLLDDPWLCHLPSTPPSATMPPPTVYGAVAAALWTAPHQRYQQLLLVLLLVLLLLLLVLLLLLALMALWVGVLPTMTVVMAVLVAMAVLAV